MLRVLYQVLSAILRPESATGSLTFRVGLFDLDLNGHMNNARYFVWANRARWVFAAKNGWLGPLIRHPKRVKVVIRAHEIKYLRPVSLFARVELQTTILEGGDGLQWCHRFFVGERLSAELLTRLAVVGDRALLESGRPIKG
jgi:YbgC/YbaW family acyl-CoA thioester hydrolase